MKVVLTSDVELWSWRNNFEYDVDKAMIRLSEYCAKNKIPIMFFVSLSDKGQKCEHYMDRIKHSVGKVAKNRFVEFGIHTHCRNLGLRFQTKHDSLKYYRYFMINEIIRWYKTKLESMTHKKIYAHRAGNYGISDIAHSAGVLSYNGITVDSSDINSGIKKCGNVYELPPNTTPELAKRMRVISPDTMNLNDLKKYYKNLKKKSNIMIINFHSFSVYGSSVGSSKISRVWHKVPAGVQQPVRRAIRLVKPMVRKASTTQTESRAFADLQSFVSYLKKDKCKFVTFKDLIC